MKQLYYTLIYIILFCFGSNATENRKEYFFAVGFREIIYVNNIKNGELDQLHKIDIPLHEQSWDYIEFNDILLQELEKDGYYYEHIDVISIKHAGFYIGTQIEGRIFEFNPNGMHWSEYKMGIERFKEIPEDKSDWNWISLDHTGYTYVSPEILEQSLRKYIKNNHYFKPGSFHYICNNSFDFVYWCLNILNDKDNRLTKNYRLNTNYTPHEFKAKPKNNIKSIVLVHTLENIKRDELLDKLFELYPPLLKYINGISEVTTDYYIKMSNIKQDNMICIPYVGKISTPNLVTTDSEIMFDSFNKTFNAITGTKSIVHSKLNGCYPKYGKCKYAKITTKEKVIKKVVKIPKSKNN